MKHLESQLQINCVKYFRLQYPTVLIFAIPNGGSRNIITASILKREGVISGIPDLFIAHGTIFCNGLFIEMKQGKGKLTDNQTEVIKKLRENNYKVEVCYSFDEFKIIVDEYLNH
ncbi:MAG TPA: VRR-NUC domain-containing protein [Candidatus Paceibacterota bacterium]